MTAGDNLFNILRHEAVVTSVITGVIFAQADEDTHTRIAQVVGDRSSQMAVADDADGFATQNIEIGVFFPIYGRHAVPPRIPAWFSSELLVPKFNVVTVAEKAVPLVEML